MRSVVLFGLLLVLGTASVASAQSPHYIAFVHGRGDDRTGQSQTQLEHDYWSNGESATWPASGSWGYSSLTHYIAANAGIPESHVIRIGYDGRAGFLSARAAGEVADRLNAFISANQIAAGDLAIVTHSMGGLVVRYILNQGVANSAYYNRVASGGDVGNGTNVNIPDNNQTGIWTSVSDGRSATINGAVSIRVDLVHTWIGDLVLTVEHAGRSVVIWNRAGGSADDIHSTFQVAGFEGTSTAGTWSLHVQDLAGADVGYVDYFAVNDSQRDFATIVNRTAWVATIEAPHTGTEAADSLYNEADWMVENWAAAVVTALGFETANDASYYMRRSVMAGASAAGGWLSDAGRTTRLYTIAAYSTDGTGQSEDTQLSLAWTALLLSSGSSWGQSGANGDGLVEELSGAGRIRHDASGSIPWYESIVGHGYHWDWDATSVAGSRTDWLRIQHNHQQGRHDQFSARIHDFRTASDTTYWIGSYIGGQFNALTK